MLKNNIDYLKEQMDFQMKCINSAIICFEKTRFIDYESNETYYKLIDMKREIENILRTNLIDDMLK